MLVLGRKKNQEICIGDDIVIRVCEIKGSTVRFGIEAPRNIRILREEMIPFEESTGQEITSACEAGSFEFTCSMAEDLA